MGTAEVKAADRPAPLPTRSATALAVTDNRTGKLYEMPITDGTIRAMDLRQIKTGPADFGLMSYDPAFMNTASCKSRITFIDGDEGILDTAATRSSSSPRRAPISRSPICCSTANCPPRAARAMDPQHHATTR